MVKQKVVIDLDEESAEEVFDVDNTEQCLEVISAVEQIEEIWRSKDNSYKKNKNSRIIQFYQLEQKLVHTTPKDGSSAELIWDSLVKLYKKEKKRRETIRSGARGQEIESRFVYFEEMSFLDANREDKKSRVFASLKEDDYDEGVASKKLKGPSTSSTTPKRKKSDDTDSLVLGFLSRAEILLSPTNAQSTSGPRNPNYSHCDIHDIVEATLSAIEPMRGFELKMAIGRLCQDFKSPPQQNDVTFFNF